MNKILFLREFVLESRVIIRRHVCRYPSETVCYAREVRWFTSVTIAIFLRSIVHMSSTRLRHIICKRSFFRRIKWIDLWNASCSQLSYQATSFKSVFYAIMHGIMNQLMIALLLRDKNGFPTHKLPGSGSLAFGL